MKTAKMLLIAALALPAAPAVAAQDAAQSDLTVVDIMGADPAPQPVIGTGWSMKKAKPGVKPQANAEVAGPSVPPPQRIRQPRQRTRTAQRPAAKQRLNNAPLVNAIAQGKRQNRNN